MGGRDIPRVLALSLHEVELSLETLEAGLTTENLSLEILEKCTKGEYLRLIATLCVCGCGGEGVGEGTRGTSKSRSP